MLTYTDDLDAERSHLDAQHVGERVYRRLGGVVGALHGHGDCGCYGPHVDDLALGCDDLGRKGLGCFDEAEEVDVEQFLRLLDLRV